MKKRYRCMALFFVTLFASICIINCSGGGKGGPPPPPPDPNATNFDKVVWMVSEGFEPTKVYSTSLVERSAVPISPGLITKPRGLGITPTGDFWFYSVYGLMKSNVNSDPHFVNILMAEQKVATGFVDSSAAGLYRVFEDSLAFRSVKTTSNNYKAYVFYNIVRTFSADDSIKLVPMILEYNSSDNSFKRFLPFESDGVYLGSVATSTLISYSKVTPETLMKLPEVFESSIYYQLQIKYTNYIVRYDVAENKHYLVVSYFDAFDNVAFIGCVSSQNKCYVAEKKEPEVIIYEHNLPGVDISEYLTSKEKALQLLGLEKPKEAFKFSLSDADLGSVKIDGKNIYFMEGDFIKKKGKEAGEVESISKGELLSINTRNADNGSILLYSITEDDLEKYMIYSAKESKSFDVPLVGGLLTFKELVNGILFELRGLTYDGDKIFSKFSYVDVSEILAGTASVQQMLDDSETYTYYLLYFWKNNIFWEKLLDLFGKNSNFSISTPFAENKALLKLGSLSGVDTRNFEMFARTVEDYKPPETSLSLSLSTDLSIYDCGGSTEFSTACLVKDQMCENGTCVVKGKIFCKNDTHCKWNQFCNPLNNLCHSTDSECQTDADCNDFTKECKALDYSLFDPFNIATGEQSRYRSSTLLCLPRELEEGQCFTDNDCEEGHICIVDGSNQYCDSECAPTRPCKDKNGITFHCSSDYRCLPIIQDVTLDLGDPIPAVDSLDYNATFSWPKVSDYRGNEIIKYVFEDFTSGITSEIVEGNSKTVKISIPGDQTSTSIKVHIWPKFDYSLGGDDLLAILFDNTYQADNTIHCMLGEGEMLCPPKSKCSTDGSKYFCLIPFGPIDPLSQ